MKIKKAENAEQSGARDVEWIVAQKNWSKSRKSFYGRVKERYRKMEGKWEEVTTGKLFEQVDKEVRRTFLYDFNYFCEGNVFIRGKQPFSLPLPCRKGAKWTSPGQDAFVSLSLHVFGLQLH